MIREATPNRLIREPLAADPRTSLDGQSLVLASRNAYPVVAGRQSRRDGLGLAAGAAIALGLGGVTFLSMSGHRTARPAAPLPPPPVAIAMPPPAPVVAIPSTAVTPVPPMRMPAPIESTLPQSLQRPVAPVMVFDTSAPATSAAVSSSTPGSAGRGAIAGSENDQFAQRVGDGEVQVASATRLSDPAATVTQGTLISAVLETAIDTDLPGYARALVSRDVKSFDGAHVLIPRSSRLIGQYKSGLAAGQTRAYVIWTRLIRPDGTSVALGSPAVDLGGSAGLAGKVDDHFMKRFSSAALLTVIGGLSAIGNASVVLSSGGSSAASVAAQRDTSIPPTIRVAQGQPIRVFTARDLDFSGAPAVATAR
jgi:type IV secretion system protein VirB10